MLLELSSIHGPRQRVERRFPASSFAGWKDEDFTVAADVALTLDVEKGDRGEVRLDGHLATTLELPCSRCLEPFVLPIDQRFLLRYVPAAENVGEAEAEVAADDLETAYYDGEKIDLGQLTREQLYLALPMKPLCGPECKGLCPNCGANRNTTTCDCDATWHDPRLDALKGLLGKQS
jgi:uncharacterized protein